MLFMDLEQAHGHSSASLSSTLTLASLSALPLSLSPPLASPSSASPVPSPTSPVAVIVPILPEDILGAETSGQSENIQTACVEVHSRMKSRPRIPEIIYVYPLI